MSSLMAGLFSDTQLSLDFLRTAKYGLIAVSVLWYYRTHVVQSVTLIWYLSFVVLSNTPCTGCYTYLVSFFVVLSNTPCTGGYTYLVSFFCGVI
jgi:hypothetical protein